MPQLLRASRTGAGGRRCCFSQLQPASSDYATSYQRGHQQVQHRQGLAAQAVERAAPGECVQQLDCAPES